MVPLGRTCRAVLATALAFAHAAQAAPLPSIDSALKTGERAPHDAAVVIGIEDYYALADVPYAKRDAAAFYDFLLYTRGVPPENLRLLHTGANKEKILTAVDDAASRAGSEGTVWVYFSGHGAAHPKTGERVLLGIDAQPDVPSVEARSILLSELKSRASAGGGRVMMVLDTCYAGKGRDGGDLLLGKRIVVPAGALPGGDRVAVWTAASANEMSGPLDAVQHGAFTYFVLGALRGWADGQLDDVRDDKVTAAEAQLYVEASLRAIQVVEQTPVLALPDGSSWVLSEGQGKFETAPEIIASSLTDSQIGQGSGGGHLAGWEPKAVLALPTGSATYWTGPASGYVMRRVEPGTVLIATAEDPGSQEHLEVTLPSPYYVGVKEVTQDLWERVKGENPAANRESIFGEDCGQFQGISLVSPSFPVMCIDWKDAVSFANALSKTDGLKPVYRIRGHEVTWDQAANGYRLPTEAEWEYAARAGTATRYVGTDEEASICDHGNVADATGYGLSPSVETSVSCSDGVAGLAAVGSYRANAWDLHDMGGNVSEWVWAIDPPMPWVSPQNEMGLPDRPHRGASWYWGWTLEVATRSHTDPEWRDFNLGVRLVRSAQ